MKKEKNVLCLFDLNMNESFESDYEDFYFNENLENFRFYFEGVALLTTSIFGLVANAVALAVLLRPRMRETSFHHLLAALAVTDIVYLFFSPLVFSFGLLWADYDRYAYPRVLPWAFGFAHVGRVGSVYLTMSVTLER